MTELDPKSLSESGPVIRIVGLNIDKTRKQSGSETIYQAYFALSENPPQAWKAEFEQKWSGLHAGHPLALQESGSKKSFVVMSCPLEEIPRSLPMLKKVVAATNRTYKKHLQQHEGE